MHERLRIVFMGTPDFAAVILRRLAAWDGAELVAAYCREDKPAGRGHKLTPPPVKVAAQALGLPVMQPKNFKQQADVDALAAFNPDILAVAAYGLILPQRVLDIPHLAPINVHASLLPRYRGAAPIQRAIIDGGSSTGITIMRMEAGLDTGPMLAQRALGIGVSDTAAVLHDELAALGAQLLVETLEAYRRKEPPTPIAQNDALATYAARMDKEDGFIDWSRPAHEVHARIRGVTPWPGARATAELPGREAMPMLLSPGRIGEALPVPAPAPGSILGLREGALAVACADRIYLIPAVRLSGKNTLDATAFWNGYGTRDRQASPHPLGCLRTPQAGPPPAATGTI